MPSEQMSGIDPELLFPLRGFQRSGAQGLPFPFPVVRGGIYRLRGGGVAMISGIGPDDDMCVGIKTASGEYSEGCWLWHIEGPHDWATAARGMPGSGPEHPLDIVAILGLPSTPRPWWRRAWEWVRQASWAKVAS